MKEKNEGLGVYRFLAKKNTRFRIIGFICEFGGEWREEL